jgi:hypothetical protein
VSIAARQIGKIAWCVLGDEDSSFFHSRASSRLRSNLIKTLESGGTRFFIHKEKERVLTNYYRDILEKSFPPQDLLDLEGIYPNSLNLASLTSPFSEAEIHKSPGPDGFGSAFFQDFWNLVKPDINKLFSEFYNNQARLDRNNRSYIILIKKKDGNCTPNAYRPISLLNVSVKLITKV